MLREDDKPWQPLIPAEVDALFAGASFPWWLAGGYAIERAVGRAFRAHEDIDVMVLHRDHAALRLMLADWDCWMADPPGTLRPWAVGEAVPPDVHDVWCRRTPSDPWALQVMFDGAEGDTLVTRRDPRVRLPLSALGSDHCLPPEVQLFYKAKGVREKDQADFEAALPVLGEEQRKWLSEVIITAHGDGHVWLGALNRRHPGLDPGSRVGGPRRKDGRRFATQDPGSGPG
ncbi:nucleotidyltransferase domain-containing protein [Lacibacterium aquatile]|uniref:Nucleotidyltransferase domain-containing protein n=1 Tax=Lacibacterium aquatile TaxID=1168082 RepID=A0ABW5DNB1_9PROT